MRLSSVHLHLMQLVSRADSCLKEKCDGITVLDRRIGGFAYPDSYPSLALFCVANGK